MFDFILQIITFGSLAFIVYLFVRALPRVPDHAPAPARGRKNYFDMLMRRLPLTKADAMINTFWGKTLRRLKVLVMKVDNVITGHLRKVKKSEEENGLSRLPLPPEKGRQDDSSKSGTSQ